MKKRIVSVITALVCAVSTMTAVTLNSVEAASVPGYNDAESYAAASLINGLIKLETGESSGNGMYTDAANRDYYYQQLAENLIDKKHVLVASEFWITTSGAISNDFSNLSQTNIYEILLTDYLQNSISSTDAMTELVKKQAALAEKTFKALDDKVIKDSKEDLAKMIKTAESKDDPKIVKAMEEMAEENDVKKYKSMMGEIQKTSTTALEYMQNLSKVIAVKQLNDEKIEFLLAMKANASDNKSFCRAVDNIINTMESSYGELAFNQGVKTMAKYVATSLWGKVKAEIPALKTIELAKDGLDLIFDGDKKSANHVRMVLQYTAGCYARLALHDAFSDYLANPTEENAEIFNYIFVNYCSYQKYSSEWAKEYMNRMANGGWFSDLFMDEDQLYQAISQLNSDANAADGYADFIRKCRTLFNNYVYDGKYLEAEENTGTGTGSGSGVDIELSSDIDFPVLPLVVPKMDTDDSSDSSATDNIKVNYGVVIGSEGEPMELISFRKKNASSVKLHYSVDFTRYKMDSPSIMVGKYPEVKVQLVVDSSTTLKYDEQWSYGKSSATFDISNYGYNDVVTIMINRPTAYYCSINDVSFTYKNTSASVENEIFEEEIQHTADYSIDVSEHSMPWGTDIFMPVTPGETIKLNMLTKYDGYFYESSNEEFIKVNDNGIINVVGEGEGSISLINPYIDKNIKLNFSSISDNVTVEEHIGSTFRLSDLGENATYASSDESVVMVSPDGVFTTVGSGKATITQKDSDGNKTSVNVYVGGVFNVDVLKRFLAKESSFSKEQFDMADLNNDGCINVFDLCIAKRQAANENISFGLLGTAKNIELYKGAGEGSLRINKDGSITVNTLKVGDYNYEMQAMFTDLTLIKGKTYQLEYSVQCDKTSTYEIGVQQNYDPYKLYYSIGYQTVSPTPQKVVETFTMTETVEGAKVYFGCGHSAGTYTFSDISLTCID